MGEFDFKTCTKALQDGKTSSENASADIERSFSTIDMISVVPVGQEAVVWHSSSSALRSLRLQFGKY